MGNNETRISDPGEPGLVSVVIPTYNRAYILGRTIESVLQQTYRPVDVIVIDDGSTDDTRRLVEAFGAPVRYFYQSNAGVSAARNRGFREAHGEFVALLDSDDSWCSWKLEAQVQLMQSFPDLGMIWTDMAAVDSDGTVVHPAYLRIMYDAHKTVRIEEVCQLAGRLGEFYPDAPPDLSDRPFYHGDIFSEMIMGSLVHTSTVMLRRTRLALVGGFDESLIISGEDYEFHLHTSSYGPVGFLDAASVLYRTGADDQLSAPRFMLYCARNNLATVRKWLIKGKGRITLPVAAICRHLAECHEWLGSEKYVAGDYWGGRVSHLQSLWYRPWQPRLWVHLLYHFLPSFVRHGIHGLRRRHTLN